MITYPIIKIFFFWIASSFNLGVYGQSFDIGEPKGTLDRVITHYMQTENVGENIIDVEVKQIGDTTIFCVGQFRKATDIFLCLPSAVYKKGKNYIFVKSGYECFFSFNEAYIRFIYSLALKYTRLNLSIKSYSPIDIEYTDKVLSTGGGNYLWYWYYVFQFDVIRWEKNDRDHYSTCSYGGG